MVADTPLEIRFQVWRDRTALLNPEADQRFHEERAAFLHKLAQDLNLDVVDWGQTDSREAHEVIEITVAILVGGAAAALVSEFKAWIDRSESTEKGLGRDVWLPKRNSDPYPYTMRNATLDEILNILPTVGRKPDDTHPN
jgi:hypothetical protein